MASYKCPICDTKLEIADTVRIGERITCTNCYAQLALRKHKRRKILTCPTCKEEIFDPQNCEECDTRREKKRLLEEGRL
jgi:hypothetical protein